MREAKKLSAVAIASLKKPGRYAVGDGAYLQISANGTKAWIFRYQRNGRAHHMGLGPVSLISLAEARQKAREARRALLDDGDPLQLKREKRMQARIEAAQSITFRDCAERLIASHEAAWKNSKHRQQWRNTLATYVYPGLGDPPVGVIDTGMVLAVLEPIWTTKAETAGRVRGRIEAVLDWAKARGYREGENPARWRGHLDKLLPNRRKVRAVKNHPAMPYALLPEFMQALRQRTGMSARALEFAILTAARTTEVLGATWAEIDLEAGMWTIPAHRMKAGRDHRVPLSDPAVDLLRSLRRESAFVFPGSKYGKPLSNMALLELMRGMRPGFVPHGFRSTFRDWAAETTAFPSEVVEMALAHAVPSKVEAAYRRGDLFEKRRQLVTEWARYCAGEMRDGTVVALRSRGS